MTNVIDAIVDREGPIEALTSLAGKGGRHLALLYGRRRIGKTYLLTHLWPREDAFYFTASATSPDINRRVLIAEAAGWSGEDLRPEDHPTWRTALRAIFELAPDRDLVVVMDEFQYLADDEDGLREVASELNAVWEGRLRRTGGLLVVLSGSAIRTLEALQSGGSPLYGRLDWSDQLHPFDYYDAAAMVPGYDAMDRLRAYAAFGGIPAYLAAIDEETSLERNIIDLLLSPSGQVRLRLETVLAQEEGLRAYATYQGILASVGIGRPKLGEIAAHMNRSLDTGLRQMVGRLVDLEFLRIEVDFEESRNQGLRYRIADPALRMYYGLVLPNESAIAASGAETVWEERLAGRAFPSYAGQHVFEEVVRQAYLRHFRVRGLPAVEEWGQWAGQDRDGRDLQIDVVARLLDGRALTGAAKMRAGPIGADVLIRHLTDLRRLADSGRRWAHEALDPDAPLLFTSAGGFKDSFVEAAGDLEHPVIMWSAEDLF